MVDKTPKKSISRYYPKLSVAVANEGRPPPKFDNALEALNFLNDATEGLWDTQQPSLTGRAFWDFLRDQIDLQTLTFSVSDEELAEALDCEVRSAIKVRRIFAKAGLIEEIARSNGQPTQSRLVLNSLVPYA